tara:strand:+ start:11547 stop:12239 length:693 start_codon:yes stop_codon:yes gene_type:complete
MYEIAFLVPIDHRGIPGRLFNQWLPLNNWCQANNSTIVSASGMFLNFARNALATAGHNWPKMQPIDAESLFWIDSDIEFSLAHIEKINSLSSGNPFLSGWYKSDFGPEAIAGNWDEKYFREHLRMPMRPAAEFVSAAESDENALIEVDFCGFGFTKIHRSIFEALEYPYFPLNNPTIHDCTGPDHAGDPFSVKDLSFEDVSFCRNVFEKTGVRPKIAAGVRVGHLKSFVV